MRRFSRTWVRSTQPRKQRKYRNQAPLHVRQKLMAAHLDKKLREQYNKRSLQVRKGDEVVVMNGEHRGKKGLVATVDMKKLKIYVDTVKVKKVSGQDVQMALDPSNVKITKLMLDDRMRKKAVDRAKGAEPKKSAKAEKKE
ncbi:MAG: 50S ribosomal protein L24 [Candidatus Aenigmarchaeota archaeon]|nr:50S ribosomal protein L24 [Candidatus Aenigmarchaeota archaeon]